MEPGPAFDMWRDYLGLSTMLVSPSPPPEPNHAGNEPPAPEQADPVPAPSGKAACAFCKHNGEARQVYGGHSLRDAGGRVLCPVLRSYVCPQCGATQDRAHTKRFCPLTRRGYTSVYTHPLRGGAGKRASGDAEK